MNSNQTSLNFQDSLTTHSVLDTLTSDSVPENPLTDSLTTHSVLDTLTGDSVQSMILTSDDTLKVVGLDWERDGWRASFGGAPSVRISRDDLLDEPFEGIDLVVVEGAHMRERNAYSVAQVYTADELRRLRCRDKIKLFPSMPGQLAKAARAVGNTNGVVNEWGAEMPDKSKDSETMALYAALSPERVASWKPLRLVGEDPSRRLWPAREILREDLREALNPLRAAWSAKGTAEKYALPEVAIFCDLIDRIYEDLTPEVREQFGIEKKRTLTVTGKPTVAGRIANGIRVERMTAALTCFLAVYDREGNLRRRPDGEFIGIRFILDSIGLSSSYRPNMARSQLTHHGMRHYKGGRDGGHRSEYMRNLKHFLAAMRDGALDDSLTTHSVLDALTKDSVLLK